MKQPLDYNSILYNEVIFYLEQKWQRSLNAHEKQILIEGYKFGRLVETENHFQIGFSE